MNWIKYIPFILIGITFLWVTYRIVTVTHLRDWVFRSMEQDGRPSGKAIAGFACINSLLASFFICIYYSKDHVPPEFFVYTIATLIGGFYSLREVGRFIDGKFNGNGNNSSGSYNNQNIPPVPPAQVPEEKTEIVMDQPPLPEESKNNNSTNQS